LYVFRLCKINFPQKSHKERVKEREQNVCERERESVCVSASILKYLTMRVCLFVHIQKYKQGVESTFFPSRMKKYPSGLLTSIPAVDLSVIPSSMLMVMYKSQAKIGEIHIQQNASVCSEFAAEAEH